MKSTKTIAACACCISVSTVFLLNLTGCNFAPAYQVPTGAVPETVALVAGEAQASTEALEQAQALQWLEHARLRQVVALALSHNRDLRVAVDTVDKVRAQYRIARADLLPTVAAQGQGSRSRSSADLGGGASRVSEQFSASIGITSYELDLWGSIRNLKAAAWQQFLETEANRRGVEVALVAEVVNAWLTLAADTERLTLAEHSLQTRESAFALHQRMFALGAISGLTVAQSLSSVETARGDVAQYTAQLARSRHALQLVVGAPVPQDLLAPAGWLQEEQQAWAPVPQDLPSRILLQRPDVQAAEHQLIAQHAEIGAARAAFFPSISLTASTGSASNDLDALFTGPNRTWSFVPLVKLPIFSGGRLRAGLDVAQANQRIAVSQYEKSVQTAFKEVADTLADLQQWGLRLGAQQGVVTSTAKMLELSQARFDAGADDYLTLLDAQRSLYAAQQGQISLRLAARQSRITLWKALGGQWLEPAAQ